MSRSSASAREQKRERLNELLAGRPIVLVGMMGAGKTTVGRRLASRLKRTFVDSDEEVERAAGMPIEDIFKLHGEADFRAGEAKVVARLLREPNLVLGTGGGAFISAETRALIKQTAISVWLKADLDLLFARVSRRSNRPLLQTVDPKATLRQLMELRYPIYAEADVTVTSRETPQDNVASAVIEALLQHLDAMAPQEDPAHGD